MRNQIATVLAASIALLGALDAWIARQSDPLSRPEAIRRLVEQALAAKPKARRAK